jgi:hypothetical protein
MPDYTTTEESLNRFLTTISVELESLKRFTALYAPTLAPGFNAVDCLSPDENRLSAVIAMLLDPKGGHGQGAVFFKLFLSILTDGMHGNETVLENLQQIKNMNDEELQESRTEPGLEVTTTLIDDSQRRIDILLHFKSSVSNGFGLAIENKPWAIDQPRQIEAYDEYLTKRYSSMVENKIDYNFILIYLSGNGQPPGEDSVKADLRYKMEESGRFVIMSYSQLKEWCKLCAEKSQSPRLRYFIEDFAIFIRDKFEGGIPIMEEESVINSALKPENIGAAVAVGFAWPEIAHKLIEELASLSFKQSGFNPNEWELEPSDFDINTPNTGFSIKKKHWKKFFYRFAFLGKNATNFLYGIVSVDGENRCQDLSEVIVAMGNGDSSDWWPWSRSFNGSYCNWNGSDIPWVGIKKGSTVDEVVKVLKVLDQNATKTIDELETTK